MGQSLFDTVTEYRHVEAEVNRILGFSVRELCLRGPEAQLKDTRYTQPCMFVVNALSFYDAVSKRDRPDAVAGHSLGEYNALMAAGVFDLLTGVHLVARRGELMAEVTGGAMAAVLKVRTDAVVRALRELPDVDVANYNAPLQTVIAGPAAVIARAAPIVERLGASFVLLPVSAPFHSRYMASVADRFARFVDSFSFAPPSIPVMANATGNVYPSDTAAIARLLVEQITRPVLWEQSVRRLRALGVTSFVEVGPGGVLTRLCQQIEQPVGA
jgi:malonyl CoA-acyl carrier protein transacylase